jgi:hypothetical protein
MFGNKKSLCIFDLSKGTNIHSKLKKHDIMNKYENGQIVKYLNYKAIIRKVDFCNTEKSFVYTILYKSESGRNVVIRGIYEYSNEIK